MLKVGELAKRSGLTVRTLHHYDSIGLLSPSARSDAGYRLYNRDDLARLHTIQAMRRFGMALADIGTYLASPGAQLSTIVAQQIAALNHEIEQAGLLRTHLTRLHEQLSAGEEPELAAWLTTMELMNMYDKYFSKDELERLPFYANKYSCQSEWGEMVARTQALIDAGTPYDSDEAQRNAQHWMIMLERDTGGNADFLVRINIMYERETGHRELTGLTEEMGEYVLQAFAAWRLSFYEKYLAPDEMAFMRANYPRRSREWPPLIARISRHIDTGASPHDPESQLLAREMNELFCSYAGTDPQTHLKLRTAHEKEPQLLTGTFITDELLAFVRTAAEYARH